MLAQVRRMNFGMALFMTLLVRDEEDILEYNLRYHLENGVDHVIVTDNLSSDRSADIAKSFVAQGHATYVHEPDDTYAQWKWVSRMAAMAHQAGARWVMHCDADEFWMAPGGSSLKRWFARRIWPNVVVVPRHDFVCLEDDGAPFWQRMVYRKAQSTSPLGRPLLPKVAHRAAPGLVVAQGNHSVSGFRWMRKRRCDLEILHFPLRSREQYVRKITNGGNAYANNTELAPKLGMAWRLHYAELQQTGRLAFIDENIWSADGVAAGLKDGALLTDTRLADFFRPR